MGCYNTGLQSFQKWFIGNTVRSLLLEDEDVTEQVGEKIFPLVAPENTVGDFIVYSRQRYTKKSTTIGVYEDECDVAIVGISDNYDNAIALASKIDNALTGQHVLAGGIKVRINLKDSSEVFEDGKYIETLLFEIN